MNSVCAPPALRPQFLVLICPVGVRVLSITTKNLKGSEQLPGSLTTINLEAGIAGFQFGYNVWLLCWFTFKIKSMF